MTSASLLDTDKDILRRKSSTIIASIEDLIKNLLQMITFNRFENWCI